MIRMSHNIKNVGLLYNFPSHSQSQRLPRLQKSDSRYHQLNTEHHPKLEFGPGCHKESPGKSQWHLKPK